MTPHRLSSWLKPALLSVPILMIIGFFVFRSQTRPAVATSLWLPNNTSTDINFVPGATPQLYSFSASPSSATTVKFDSDTPGFSFSAEVRDSQGQAVASLGNKTQNALLTIGPDDGVYQIALSADNTQVQGKVSLAVGAPSLLMPTQTPQTAAAAATTCQAATATGSAIALYNGPGLDRPPVATLPTGVLVGIVGIGQQGGWYVADNRNLADGNGQPGWLSGDMVLLYGDCTHLRAVRDPALPIAPHDADAFGLQADRDGSGQVSEVISAPEGDTTDVIWISVLNLYDQPPSNYREFSIHLTCTGVGIEFVRWGSPNDPTQTCGSSITLPFIYNLSQQALVVTLPAGSGASYVMYTLTATWVGH